MASSPIRRLVQQPFFDALADQLALPRILGIEVQATLTVFGDLGFQILEQAQLRTKAAVVYHGSHTMRLSFEIDLAEHAGFPTGPVAPCRTPLLHFMVD